MELGIAGKWALVCGASKGLGLGCAQALATDGVNVVMVARGLDVLEAAADELRQRSGVAKVIAVAADITTEAGRSAAFAVPDGPGMHFDIVVTNAGGPPPGDFRNWGREQWIAALDANMLTPIALIKATIDGMAARGFGRIINITSGAVKAPADGLGLSNGARSGLTGFVAGVARGVTAGANVTVNNLLPGAFDTDRLRVTMQGNVQKSGQPIETLLANRAKAIPAKRFGTAQEFGAICAFLCSQHASYINGQNILADGGAYPGTF